MFKLLPYETLPCWSKLTWTPSPPAISCFVHRDIISVLDSMTDSDPRIQHYSKYGTFVNEPTRWGINGTLARFPVSFSGFTEFQAKLPQVKRQSQKPCPECGGIKSKEQSFERCFSCYGKGHTHSYDHSVSRAISASFTILTHFINWIPKERDTKSKQIQLITANLAVMDGQYPLSGECSKEFAQWLRSKKEYEEFPDATKATRVSWKRFFNQVDKLDRHRLLAIALSDGRFLISCPGDACEIASDSIYIRKDMGHEFNCHNMDSSMQQLTLLAGLAALEMQARKELNL